MVLIVFSPRQRSTLVAKIIDAMGINVIRNPENPDWEANGVAYAVDTAGVGNRTAIKLTAQAFFEQGGKAFHGVSH